MAQGLIEKIVNVKKQEWRILSWLLLFFFFESIGTEIMDILAVSTFLKEAGIRNLPIVYVIDEAFLSFFLVLYGMVVDRVDRFRFINWLQGSFAVLLALLFGAIQLGMPETVIAVLIYVLKSLIISVLEEAFWLMNDDLFDVQEAKRLYPIINLGGVTGGMVGGSLVAALLSTVVEDTNSLLPIAPVTLAAGIVFIRLARRRALKEGRLEELAGSGGGAKTGEQAGQAAGEAKDKAKKKKKKKKVTFGDGVRFIRDTPLFKYIFICFVVAGVVAPLGDWMFAAAADVVFVDKKSYATFLSIYKTCLTVVIFFAQLFLSSRILTRLGLTRANIITPANNVLKFGLLTVWFALGPAIYGQGSKKLLEKVVTKPTQRVFFGFAPRSNKGRIKVFIKNMKGNAAIATLVLLFAVLHLVPLDLEQPGPRMLLARGVAAVALLLSLYWLYAAFRLKARFTASLMDILEREEIDFAALEREDFRSLIDQKAVNFLLANLERGDEKRSIFIAGMLEEIADERVLDPVLRILPEKSAPVQAAIVRLVGRIGGGRARQALRQFVTGAEPEVRAEAIAALGSLPETDAAREIVPFLQDPDGVVRVAAARVVLSAKDVELRRRGLEVLESMLRSPDREARIRGIFLLGELGVRRNKRLLMGTIRDPDGGVRLASLEALRKMADPEDAAQLLPEMERLLDDPQAEIRRAAADVVRAIGGGETARILESCLRRRGFGLRRTAAEGLAGIGEAGWLALVRAVGDPAVDLETKELALQQMRKGGWSAEQVRGQLIPLAEKQLQEVYLRSFAARALSRLGAEQEPVRLLLKALADLDEEARVLSISIITTLADPEKIKLIQKALAGGSRQTRASVIELLESASEKNLFRLLLPILDGANAEERIELARRQWQTTEPSPEEALRACLLGPHPTLRQVAVFAVGELRLTSFDPLLRQLLGDPEESVRQEAERALRALGGRSGR